MMWPVYNIEYPTAEIQYTVYTYAARTIYTSVS